MKYFIGLLPFLILFFVFAWLVLIAVRRSKERKNFEDKLKYLSQEENNGK